MLRNRGGRGVQAAIAATAVAGVMLAVSEAGAENANDFPVGVDDAALKFKPETITVSVGDTVVWDFTGTTTVHNVVSENDVAADPAWKDYATPPATTGQFRYTFTQVGEYEYLCDLHRLQGMAGKVKVVDAPVATPVRTPRPLITATATATATADADPDGDRRAADDARRFARHAGSHSEVGRRQDRAGADEGQRDAIGQDRRPHQVDAVRVRVADAEVHQGQVEDVASHRPARRPRGHELTHRPRRQARQGAVQRADRRARPGG